MISCCMSSYSPTKTEDRMFVSVSPYVENKGCQQNCYDICLGSRAVNCSMRHWYFYNQHFSRRIPEMEVKCVKWTLSLTTLPPPSNSIKHRWRLSAFFRFRLSGLFPEYFLGDYSRTIKRLEGKTMLAEPVNNLLAILGLQNCAALNPVERW